MSPSLQLSRAGRLCKALASCQPTSVCLIDRAAVLAPSRDPWIPSFLYELFCLWNFQVSFKLNISNPRRQCSMGGRLLNTRKAFQENGKIARCEDAETHAGCGKLDLICLEAGGSTGWSRMLFGIYQVAYVEPAYPSVWRVSLIWLYLCAPVDVCHVQTCLCRHEWGHASALIFLFPSRSCGTRSPL